MQTTPNLVLAEGVLLLHMMVIAFNVSGLVIIPLGAWRGWRFVRSPTLRLLHVVSLAIVALQAAVGRACFLTIAQDALSGASPQPPMIMRWINRLIYWPAPIWVFTVLYLAVFLYVLSLLWLVPIRWRKPLNGRAQDEVGHPVDTRDQRP